MFSRQPNAGIDSHDWVTSFGKESIGIFTLYFNSRYSKLSNNLNGILKHFSCWLEFKVYFSLKFALDLPIQLITSLYVVFLVVVGLPKADRLERVCMVSNASSVQQAALTSQRILSANIEATNKSASRIATGRRIQNASDGAAELQQIERLTSQINGSQKALEATQDASNLLNTVDGATGQITEQLQRARELTIQAANDTNGPEQRAAIQTELNQISEQIDQISNNTSFNGRKLLDGSQTSFNAVTDANGGGIDIAGAFGDTRSAALGTNALNVSDSASARNSIDAIDTALSRVNSQRSQIGAFQNRLQASGSNLEIQSVNTESARSRLRDTDFASETVKFTSKKIQSQASTSVLAQTNRLSSGILSLING